MTRQFCSANLFHTGIKQGIALIINSFLDKQNALCFTGASKFSMRYGWLHKAVQYVHRHSNIGEKAQKELFDSTDLDTVAELGVGTLMVSAMRHWALGANVIQRSATTNKTLKLTEFGNRVLLEGNGLDPYMEKPETLWLIHWFMVNNLSMTTAYFLFNYFNETEFDKKTLLHSLSGSLMDSGRNDINIKDTTLDYDISATMGCYLYPEKKKHSLDLENSLVAQLATLNLITKVRYDTYRIRDYTVNKAITMPLFTYCLIEYWNRYYKESKTLPGELITMSPHSPGRVFRMHESQISSYLKDIGSQNKQLVWSESGIPQLMLIGSIDDLAQSNTLESIYGN